MSSRDNLFGVVPEDWTVTSIGNIAELRQGLQISKDLRTDNLKPGYMPLLKITDLPKREFSEFVKDIKEQYVATKDDIIYTRTGQVGLVYTDISGCVHNNCFKVIVDYDKFDKYFLYYFLKSDFVYKYSNSVASGSVQKDLKHSAFKSCPIAYPKVEEQKAIGNILSTLDKKIEVNNQINKKLEEMTQAIFKQWFVDFDFPNEEGEPYKSSGGEMVESELGMIPKGWEVKALDDIADYLNGIAMQKFRPKENEHSYPVLKIKELRQGFTDESSDLCSESIDAKYIVNDGDLIFSWSGSLLLDIWAGGKCGLNQHLFKVNPKTYDKWFCILWLDYYLENFKRIAESKATTMGHIKRKDLSDSKVLIPNDRLYKKLNVMIKPLYEEITNLKIESKRLIKVRDTLLPRLMSGEIRVPLD
ncbi:restriction endonuclease subunit S [Alkalicella caledoniensis]|uniref:Restriction endonuclease subunit S n=1 Tax=Alkalicella caledoniensis TaxID=2731377 RepID=A0A7G9W5Y9_ALKCA|nr:restriction endonuclease subunit S [Alkalicella caledoniensis]QNO14101.1 restriction endonuclease subunit S [Alkalicella caledoniensis]